MNTSQFDVIVVGAGAAGLTAAIGLARAGFSTVVIEAAAFPGAENWSGCVYFCENLAHPDILGPAGVESLAWERRLVERGFFGTDGHGLLGMTYRDPAAFRHCYTVLRPIYDHHLAQAAQRLGVTILSETTVESLIRDGGRIVGVSTQRGPLYADLVFLAEGDASHLVTREGYERFNDQREAPKFLQGIKQVIDLPPGAVEELFRVGPEEGVAYEMLVRNGTLRGERLRLNMGGFIYTNRQSLSVGLVLPADNLREHFAGDPNLLIEWFLDLPALRPWLRDGRRGVFGAKIIRGGGIKDVPHLIDDGLAIGGAASAIGVDFPYPNFTGPATRMGLLLAQAAQRIRAQGGGFTRDNLQRHYLEPLQQTHYWKDVEFLRRWPGYVKKTQVFFDRDLDLALGSAYVWTRSEQWLFTRWLQWIRLLLRTAGPAQWHALRVDFRHLTRALRLREVAGRPPLGRLLLDGTVNALRDLFGKPRPNVPPAGKLRLHYRVADDVRQPGQPAREVPSTFQKWFQRFAPILASAAQQVYANEPTPLADRLPRGVQLLVKQVNVVDLLAAGSIGFFAGVTGVFLLGWDRLVRLVRRGGSGKGPRGAYRRYAAAVQQAADLTPLVATAGQRWEERLATLAYHTVKASHIQVLWPRSLADRSAVAKQGLWHVCPAHVYEARKGPHGQLQVVVNYENCIKCETCWRTSDLVTWGRDGQHRFIYPVGSPVSSRLLESIQAGTAGRPVAPKALDPWESAARALPAPPTNNGNGTPAELLHEVRHLLDQLERKLHEFDEALAEEPRTIDRARADYLEMLARYAQQLAARAVELLRAEWGDAPAQRPLLALAGALAAKAEERSRQTWDQRFAWAAATGRQLRNHHLTGLRRLLAGLGREAAGELTPSVRVRAPWLQAEEDAATLARERGAWAARLDVVFPPHAWRDFEQGTPLSPEQDAVLRELIAAVPALDPNQLARTLHPPLRKALLAELGRRDPSLAVRVAAHLWARDLAQLSPGAPSLHDAAKRWARGEEWAAFAPLEGARLDGDRCSGEAPLVPLGTAPAVLLLAREQLILVPANSRGGCTVEPVATLGLRGAGAARVVLEACPLPEARATVDYHRFRRIWHILSAADLASIAAGMADQLCRRAAGHATSRVQFPGLFHDEEARDAVGKFGAVKKMIAAMETRRYLIETLDACLSPVDFSASAQERAGLIKATVAEALGTAPGSLSYNAGQVFGGTGYSEDDILSKFYRDASAWRFLGATNVDVYRRHGQEVLRSWRPDGQRLAGVADEVKLFEEVAQRKALQAELDEVRNLRSRLRATAGERQRPGDEPVETEFCEALARQDGHLLASKAILLRTHARLEAGLPSEVETALVRVWMDYVAESLEKFDAVVRPPRQHVLRPVVEASAGPPIMRYADYLATPDAYDSGDFLSVPLDLTRPRFVPEMVATDPALAEADRKIRTLMIDYFGRPRPGNGSAPYERYIERRHRPDPEDLDFCREHGFFRMPIPRDLGGEGRSKAEYYLVTTNAQRFVDVAISLTIQANTSIGTSPVLIARDKDLPKAQKDLGPFAGDTGLQQEVRQQLEALVKLFDPSRPPDAKAIEQAYRKLHARLEETVFARTVLKVLTHRFGEAWQQAGKAGLQFDFAGMRAGLDAALAAWKDVCNRAEDFHAEIVRRREACDLFLRWVAAGQISAFALTEPSAGSDTARVATRARLRSVPVEKVEEGIYRFVPAGGGPPRVLLDAKQLEFRPDGVFYHLSASAEPARLRFDEYDYETDDAGKLRYFEHGGRKVYFTDIAQLRQRHGKLWYDYWELTGAKMWITNGRMSGIMCLYAKVDEPWVSGVTGFIVDRHAEGLVVGKDEAKMGQCGSPTNELSLQAVRVPRENVIGLESRGQVNALETLNVGRAGLSMSSMAQMDGIIDAARQVAQARYGEIPDWVAWRLERMEEIRFVAEALGFDVIGQFEHPKTKSVRMESAVAKMLNSELLHRLIEWSEDIHGLAGQTQLHLIEKRKRDARILNIYEGTNEIQRSFILKDLAAEVAPRWAKVTRTLPQHVGQEALELEALKNDFRQRVESARSLFGAELWQNPNLQANCFLLAEAAAWLKAAESTLGRIAWLNRCELDAGDTAELLALPLPHDLPALLLRGRQALARCQVEVKNRLQRFDEELTHLRRGFYAPEIRAASLVFVRQEHAVAAPQASRSTITQPLHLLVVVEPTAAHLPQPHVSQGHLLEPRLALSAADRAALETALQLREQADATVTIDVVAVAGRTALSALREALNLSVDRARLLVPELEAVTPDTAAAALAQVLRPEKFDLILFGETGTEDEGVLGRLLASALGVRHAGTAARLSVRATGGEALARLASADGRSSRLRGLPAAVGLEAGVGLRPFRIGGFLEGLSRSVDVIRWPKKVPARTLNLTAHAAAAATQEEQPQPLTPPDAALRLLGKLGHGGTSFAPSGFDGAVDDLAQPRLAEWHRGVIGVAVIAADADGRLHPSAPSVLKAARALAAHGRGTADGQIAVVQLVPAGEELQRRALGQLLASHRGTVLLIPAEGLPHMQSELLIDCWPALTGSDTAPGSWVVEGGGRVPLSERGFSPRFVVGEPWTEDAFATLAARQGPFTQVALRVRRLRHEDGETVCETSRGKLAAQQHVDAEDDETVWLSLAGEVEAQPDVPAPFEGTPRVLRWVPPVERLFGRDDVRRLLDEVKQETGLVRLADADFIIDVGYGVGNRDGYEAVIEPLERTLRALGVKNLVVGGSRKVTEELRLLPVERQIGQSGVSVNPQLLLAIGVSGAPQHLNYIGPRATVLAFNRDPEAPLLTLNARQARPRVFPVIGDLFETVPAFTAALQDELSGQAEPAPERAPAAAEP